MSAQDYSTIFTKLSPSGAVQWLSNQFLSTWVKVCAKNAPYQILKPGQDKIGVKVDNNDQNGAELWVDPKEVAGKLPYLETYFCLQGVPVIVKILVIDE